MTLDGAALHLTDTNFFSLLAFLLAMVAVRIKLLLEILAFVLTRQ